MCSATDSRHTLTSSAISAVRPDGRPRGRSGALCGRTPARAAVRPDVRPPWDKNPSSLSTKEFVMTETNTAKSRLEDIRELEPTSNSELRDRWGMDSGKDVARYLKEELGEYTYRDDNSKIRAVERDGPEADTMESPGAPDAQFEEETSDEGAPEDTVETSAPNDDPADGLAEPQTRTEPPQEPADTSNLVPAEQVQEVAENAERAGYEAGLDDGYQAAEHEQPETDQTTDENTLEPDSRATCPECGEPMFTGEELETILNERAKTDKAARKFIKANEGAAPDRACREIYECGYYVENGEANRFETPGGGWVKKLITVGGTAAAGAIGLAAITGNDEEASPWDRV